MKGDIALAGFVLTKEEWQALDPVMRAQLLSAATQGWAPSAAGSGPIDVPADEDLTK